MPDNFENNNPNTNTKNINPLGDLGASNYNITGRDILLKQKRKRLITITVSLLLLLSVVAFTFYYFTKGKNDLTLTDIGNGVIFPDLSNSSNQYYNTSDLSSTSTVDASGYQSLLKIWNTPVIGYAYKKEKTREVLSSEFDYASSSAAASSSGEASLNGQNIREVESDTIYFVDAGDGNIYKRRIDGKQSTQPEKVSRTNITGIDYAVFNKSVSKLAIIKSRDLIIDDVSVSLDGTFNQDNKIDNNVNRVYSSSFDDNFVYTKLENGGTNIYKYEISSGRTSNIGFVPLSSVSLIWSDSNLMYVITNPSDVDSQKVLTYNLGTNKLNSYFVGGSDTIVQGSDFILSQNGTIYYKNLAGKTFSFDMYTFANKCFFLLDSRAVCAVPSVLSDNSVSNWYKGASSFRDSLSMINYSTGYERNILNLSDVAGESIDLYKPVLAGDNKVFFVNKNTNSLWSLDMNMYLGSVTQPSI
ncbi:MAG: hypothetical protein QG614_611 [Patescibacteria group bacterium]|nr:hypothetical protein [Patescibacteria group bacterium]